MLWCILVQGPSKTEVIGPFASPQEAARYSQEKLSKALGQVAVAMPMTKPESDVQAEPGNS